MKGKKITREEIKEGGIYIASDDCSGCWKVDGKPIPFRVNRSHISQVVDEMTSLDGTRTMYCDCSDLDNLYEWVENGVIEAPKSIIVDGVEYIPKGSDNWKISREEIVKILLKRK